MDPDIFVITKTGTSNRGHGFTLEKGQSRLDVRKHSFPQRTINEWSKLSTDCVHSSSINMFKNRVYNYLVGKGKIYVDSYM